MNDQNIEELKLYDVGGQYIVHVPTGRGEELRLHLASHGIKAVVSPLAEGDFDRLELENEVDVFEVQTILDHWEK
ncbi:MAG: hypothetical protein JO112_05335 [Planctomycetes bacterium]|nr:hypothetical protein [Planctomycetota bacterium]